jgi:Peptidase propeptide and YPEB domain
MRLSVGLLSAALLAGSAGMAIAAGGDQLAGSATKVQAKKLEGEGYTDVRIGERDKGYIEVTAAKDGKTEKLAVNPQSGQVTPNTNADDD